MRITVSSIVVACALPWLVSCSSDPGQGNLVVTYRFGGAGNTCESESVTTIEAALTLSDSEMPSPSIQPCDIDTIIAFDNIDAGRYDLVINGVSSEGYTIRDNLDAPARDDRVEIISGSSQELTVTLTPTPVTIFVRWKIFTDDGSPIPSCRDAVPQMFEVVAYNGSSALVSQPIAYCDADAGFNKVPDPDRDIAGDKIDGIAVSIFDRAGDELERLEFSVDPPGPGRDLQLDVECQATRCTGTLEEYVPPPAAP